MSALISIFSIEGNNTMSPTNRSYFTIMGSGSATLNQPGLDGSRVSRFVKGKAGAGVYITNFEEINTLVGNFQVQKVVVPSGSEVTLPSGGSLDRRRSITLTNTSSDTVYIGHISGMAIVNMFPIAQNGSLTMSTFGYNPIYAISAGTSDVRILEVE
jgi:hypothetical protein